MSQYAFYFDGTRCTECKTCMFACKDYKDTDVSINFRKVFEVTGGSTDVDASGAFTTTAVSYAVSSACQHCDTPACMAACPMGAISKDEETGLVLIDDQLCDGCGMCVAACPYGAPKVDTQVNVAVKCDGCFDRVRGGEQKPVCVMACPCDALDFGTVEEMQAKGERAAIVPFPEPELTGPNLFVKASEDAAPSGDDSVAIANPLEL